MIATQQPPLCERGLVGNRSCRHGNDGDRGRCACCARRTDAPSDSASSPCCARRCLVRLSRGAGFRARSPVQGERDSRTPDSCTSGPIPTHPGSDRSGFPTPVGGRPLSSAIRRCGSPYRSSRTRLGTCPRSTPSSLARLAMRRPSTRTEGANVYRSASSTSYVGGQASGRYQRRRGRFNVARSQSTRERRRLLVWLSSLAGATVRIG